jgi:glucose dehydrogenase
MKRLVGFIVVVLALTMPLTAFAQSKGERVKPSPYAFGKPLMSEGNKVANATPQPAEANWAHYNGDLLNSGYSPLDQINTSNASKLKVAWAFSKGSVAGSSFQNTPIVVDGVMYITSEGSNIFAVNAATGDLIWKFSPDPAVDVETTPGGEFGVINKGAAYGDGKVFVGSGDDRLFAVDAATGQLAWQVLVADPKQGSTITMAPQFFNGKVIVTTGLSEQMIPTGFVVAYNAADGKELWRFKTVPQASGDDGWEIAGSTWMPGPLGLSRNGGGSWTTPAVDPDLGLLYVAVGNPTVDFDASNRLGANLFTNSLVVLDVNTGKLKGYFQAVHHDIWDYDQVTAPFLFNTSQGRKGVGITNKSGFMFLFDRDVSDVRDKPVDLSSRALFPIYEVPVSTVTEIPGDVPFPTQPQSSLRPFTRLFPENIPLDIASRPDVQYRLKGIWDPIPASPKAIIQAPGTLGGTNFGRDGYSPKTGLIYVAGIDQPVIVAANLISGALPNPGDGSFNALNIGVRAESWVTAYDANTGRVVFQTTPVPLCQGGVLATGGGLVLYGTADGYLRAIDGRTGLELFKFNTGAGIHAGAMTYAVNGKQYVAIAAGGGALLGDQRGSSVFVFTLPDE